MDKSNNKIITRVLKYKHTPFIGVFVTLIIAILWLHQLGRIWICSCGKVLLWVGDAWSSDNSQHIADPYSSSHFLHGLVFYAVIHKLFPKMKWQWNFFWTVLIESGWEVLENTEFIINRYREATASLGYTGDSIVNSVADIGFCIVGFFFYKRFGFKISLIAFLLVEVIMSILIKDGLILNIIMLIHPIDAIRVWQTS